MAKVRQHFLSAASKVFNDVKGEFPEKPGDKEKPYATEAPVPADELKKVAKWFQHTVTKFGASAAVAEGPRDPALKAPSEEVVKAFTAAQGTLLSLRRGAGPSLCAELTRVSAGLAEAIDGLGAAIGTPKMAVCAGKALERCKHLERISTHNQAAVRRRLLTSLSQLRDANRELSEALKHDADSKSRGGAAESDDESDDLGDFDEELEPEERRVVELVVTLILALEDMLKKASHAASASAEGAVSIADLEAAVKHAVLAANAVDSLSAHVLGGLDIDEFNKSLKELREAATVLAASFPVPTSTADGLTDALDACEAALREIAEAQSQEDLQDA